MALGPCAPNADLGHDTVMIKSSNKIEHSEENLGFEKKIGALGVGKSLMLFRSLKKIFSASASKAGGSGIEPILYM